MAQFNREREQEIERRVKRRIQRRMLLVLNFALLFIYAMVISSPVTPQIFGIFGVLWSMGFVAHAALVVYQEWAERAVRRALEQERNLYYRAIAETVLAELQNEKPKRRDSLALSDDGELLDPLDEQTQFNEREYRKRR